MSLQDIYDALDRAIDQGHIDLSATTVTGLGLTLVAVGVTGAETLRISGPPVLTRDEAAVTLSGIAAQYRGFTWTATLVGTYSDGANHFALTLQGRDDTEPWRFGTSFPLLPQTRRAVAGKPGVQLAASVLTPLIVTQPVLSVTAAGPKAPDGRMLARFEGWLPLAGTELQPYVQWLLTSRLRLGGQIDFTPPAEYTAPRIDIWGAAPGVTLPLLTTSEVGVKLLTDQPDTVRLASDPPMMSAAALYARVAVGTQAPLRAELTTPLMQGDQAWPLAVDFAQPQTVGDTLALLLELLGADPALLSFPLADALLRSFGVTGLQFLLRPLEDTTPPFELLTVAVDVAATNQALAWVPAIPFIDVKLTGLGAGWVYRFKGDDSYVTGSVWGKLQFAERDGQPVTMTVNATIPQMDIEGSIMNLDLPLLTVLKRYLGGGAGPDPIPGDVIVENVRVLASPKLQTYEAHLLARGDWDVDVGTVRFALERISAIIRSKPDALSGQVTGFASIEVLNNGVPGPAKAKFLVTAAYDGKGVWNFSGGLAEGTLDVVDFVTGLLGRAPSVDGLPGTILLTELWLTYQTSGGTAHPNPYSARGTLVARWRPELLGQNLSLTAKARIARRKQETAAHLAIVAARPELADGEMIYEGEVYGTLRVNQLAVTAGLSFVGQTTTYLFEVSWGRLTLRAVTLWVADRAPPALPPGGPPDHHEALAISLRGMTLGEIVEELVNLANPNQNYRLEAPWSVLNAIDLSRLSLVIDPTEQTIALRYEIALELVFMSITAVGLVYDRSAATPGIRFQVEGKLLDKTYSRDAPLTWDALGDSPPDVAGQGTRLFELRYLGAGQHVTLKGVTTYTSIKAVLRTLREQMQPVDDPTRDPFAQSDLLFDESSQWLVGFDATAMDTVSLGIVMHDPDLYGLVVGLSGEKAQSLAGLEFELLYRKVTDSVGAFRVRLQVPDAFREIQLGPVAITLGVITVEVFTNGNFMVDLGFPHNRDFESSFGLQAGPFIGSGGIYFALLEGATSTRVPQITNGTFSPVLELGIGISAGVGRRFSKGPLEAELSLQVVGIFEGVLAWFNPTDASQPTALYWSARGTAGIVGKLYGSVDFKVIKVAVSVEAHALVTVTLGAYRAGLVELDVGVSVSAEVTIVFVTVSFSFELRLQTSFAIGADERAPWALSAGETGRSPARLLDNVTVPRRRRAAQMAALTALLDAPRQAQQYTLEWNPAVHVFPDQQAHPVAVKLLPAYAVDQVPVQWPGQTVTARSSAYRVALMAMIDDPTDKAEPAFDDVIAGLLRWALDAAQHAVGGSVTAAQLRDLAAQLELPQTMTQGFAMPILGQFLATNLPVKVSGMPSGDPAATGGTAFPIPPPLGFGWSTPPEPPDGCMRRFTSYQPVDATYEAELAAYFAHLEPGTSTGAPSGGESGVESLATFVFRDYLLMVTRAAVQGAIDVIDRFPYVVTGAATESLATICSLFAPVQLPYTVHQGDGVDQVADYFGLSASEATYLNPTLAQALENATPGSRLNIAVGATPESVASANPSRPLLASSGAVPIGDLVHQLSAGESLAGVATTLGATIDSWLQTPALRAQRDLLRADAPLPIANGAFLNTGWDFTYAAALLYVRLALPDESLLLAPDGVPLVEWYAQTIASKNAVVADQPFPATLTVPVGYDQPATTTLATQPGDTVARVAASLALAQNAAADPTFSAWLEELRTLNPTQPQQGPIVLPASTATTIVAGETLDTLADRLPIVLPDPAHSGDYLDRATSFGALVGPAAILAPLTPVTVPDCHVPTLATQTLGTFAALYALSLEEVGARLAHQTGLLAWSEDPLIVAHPGSAPVGGVVATGGDLVSAVVRAHGGSISGQVSRFLMHGMRPPAPVYDDSDRHYHARGAPTGLFELIGQQIDGPAPPAWTDPTTPELTLAMKVCDPDPEHPWVTLHASAATAGVIALTAQTDTLTLTITAGDLKYPAPLLAHEWIAAPAPLPLYRDLAVHHPLQQRLLWQTTEALTFPQGAAPKLGMPTLWPFPSELSAAAAKDGARAFALKSSDPALGPAAPDVELQRFAWATCVDVRIRRLPGLTNTYELLGADTAGRQVLLALWRHLQADTTASATLHLLYQPPPTTGLPNGMASAPLDPALTFVIETNLSTETRSDSPTAVRGDPPNHFASIGETQRFLQLVWECSVVGGGGYWLDYAAADGSPLPASIFAADGSARLMLVSMLASQTGTNPDRVIYDFNTCAVVGETVDASAVSLFATTSDETTRQATVAAGNVGLAMQIAKPVAGPAFDAAIAARQMYALAAYALAASPEFGAPTPPVGLPVGPQVPTTGAALGDDGTWDIRQVVPISRFALHYHLPQVDGLPDPRTDPYAGLPDAPPGQLASAALVLGFNDVLGNASLSTGDAAGGGPLSLTLPVGYTDALLGLGEWPATTASYRVVPADGAGAVLEVAATLQTGAYLPGPTQRAAAATTMASQDLERLRTAYFQVMQPDVTATLSSTLDEVDGAPVAMPVPIAPLRRFAAAAYAYLGTAAQLVDVYVGTSAPTLAALSARCGVGFDALAAANRDVPLGHLFVAPPPAPVPGTDLTLPIYAVFRAGGTFASYCPASSSPAELLRADDNATLPLRPSGELVVPSHPFTVDPDPTPPSLPPTLREIAAQAGVTVASLARANAATRGLLRVGAVLSANGVTVIVDPAHPEVSFDDVAATFRAEGVPFEGSMVAGANADVAGLVRPGAVLAVDRYLVADGDTLAHNATGTTTAELAGLNVETTDLFATGTPVYVGFEQAGDALEQPLGAVAAIRGIAPEQVLRHNQRVALAAPPSQPDASWPVVPGQVALPSVSAALRVPFAIPANATLDGIATLFVDADPSAASPALALATANAQMPGTLAPNVTITVGSRSIQTGTADAFADAVAAFGGGVTLADVVGAIATQPGYLATGALLLCPPAKLASGGPAAYTAAAVATRYGFTAAADVPVANATIVGIVAPQVTLTLPAREPGKPAPTIVTGAGDTFNSLVWRFAQQRVQTSIAEIVGANPDAELLLAGALLLLPPAPAIVRATFGATPAGWRVPGAIFPIHVWVEIARDVDRVDPDFRGTTANPGAAVRARVAVPPLATAGADRTLALADFAATLQAAVAGLRAATGRVRNEQREPASTDVWGVMFGPGQITSLAIEPGAGVAPAKRPRYFALRPLENQLVARNQVPIKPLLANGTLGEAVLTDFQGIDMEVWARRLLTDVDLFLSAPYAAAAYRVAPTALEQVVRGKQALAHGVADGLDYVLDADRPSDGTPSPAYASARAALLQRLLVGLADGYTTAVVTQYDAAVDAPGVRGVARLSGAGRLPTDPSGEQLRTSVSAAKTSLGSGVGYVNFLVDTAEEGVAESVVLPFEYAIDEVEFDVTEIVDGYEASSWLSLITPFDGTSRPPGVTIDIGAPEVPLPLRSYPPLPSLIGHSAAPATPAPATYADALRWDYTVQLEHRSAATDRIQLTLHFNAQPALRGDDNEDPDLFAALAQYVAVAADLWALLQRLPDATASDPVLVAAITAFAGLVGDAASRWAAHWAPPPTPRDDRLRGVGGRARESYVYTGRLEAGDRVDGVSHWADLLLERTAGAHNPSGGDVTWPFIDCVLPDGTHWPMGQGVDTPRGRQYAFPGGDDAIPVLSQVGYVLRFPALHVGRYQSAAADVRVTRNAQLIAAAPTSAPFVYQTTTLAFPSTVVPLLSWNQRFDIGAWSDAPAQNPLAAVFTAMFDGDASGRGIACAIRYGYELGGSAATPLVTYLPVKLRPGFTYDAATVGDVVGAIVDWRRAESPVTTGGEWVVSLTMFSSVADTRRPVLELKRLFSRAGLAP